jgi:hypothetical protein
MTRRILPIATMVALVFFPLLASGGWPTPTFYQVRHQPLVTLHASSWVHVQSSLEQTATGDVYLPLHLEQGETVGSVSVMWRGGPGHTADPVSIGIITPTLAVYRVDRAGAHHWLCGAKDPDTVSPAEYEAPHAITASCSFTADLASGIYVARLLSENTAGWHSGGVSDYQPGGLLTSAWVTVR